MRSTRKRLLDATGDTPKQTETKKPKNQKLQEYLGIKKEETTWHATNKEISCYNVRSSGMFKDYHNLNDIVQDSIKSAKQTWSQKQSDVMEELRSLPRFKA